MKSLINIIIFVTLTLSLNAQLVEFNTLKEATLGNLDALKKELIENGFTRVGRLTFDEFIQVPNETDVGYTTYAYNYDNSADLATATLWIDILTSNKTLVDSSLTIMVRSDIEMVLKNIIDEIKTHCSYQGITPGTDFICPDCVEYIHSSGVLFQIGSEMGDGYIIISKQDSE